ncbi:aspartyl protease AED3-like, partial [Prunus avium]
MATLSFVAFSLCLLFFSLAQGLSNNPQCSEAKDQGSNLQVFHVYSPCSPFRPTKPMSWEESVLQMQADDQARLQFLSSLVAKKSVVPIASGRQIIQSPTYIVRAKIGTPPQTLLLAVDTSNDAAWVPCNGCVGCGSNVFNSAKSTTYKTLGCQTAQCKQ